MTSTVSVEWTPLSSGELAKLAEEYPMERFGNVNSAMNDIWNRFQGDIGEGNLDISDPETSLTNIKNYFSGVVRKYAQLQESQYTATAQDHAVYAIQRMMKTMSTKGHDARAETALTTAGGVFEVKSGDSWNLGGRTMSWSEADIGGVTGIYGGFGENALFASGVGADNAGIAPYARSLPDLLSRDNLLLSAIEVKTTTGTDVKIGTVTINIQRPLAQKKSFDAIHETFAGSDDWKTGGQAEAAVIALAKESLNDFGENLAKLLEDPGVLNFIVGRTLGVIKLFEKMISVLIFGVEVREMGIGAEYTKFNYTAATMFANLKYREVIERMEATYGKKAKDYITVRGKWDTLTEKGGSESFYAKIVLTAEMRESGINIGDRSFGEDFKMTSDLYKTSFDIFKNEGQRIALFKAMYTFQKKGTIATNIEVLEMINDAKKIK